jgi:CxxC motif-containing protein (DUF1111 family)
MRWALQVRSFRRRTHRRVASSDTGPATTQFQRLRTTPLMWSRLQTSCDQRRLRAGDPSRPQSRRAMRSCAKSVCASCHVQSITTAAPGTVVNGGKLTVPAALGNKIFHPYSDFLLHDVGTGVGIPVLPDPEFASTAAQIRTAPLWALRTRNRLMHDGLSFTLQEAIRRHAGQAAAVTSRFNALTADQQASLLAFLNSL